MNILVTAPFCMVCWIDNNVVTTISYFDHTFPVKHVQRHIKGQPSKTQVNQPRMIANYRAGVGGLDLMDHLLGFYRPQIKGKKWWWPLFVNAQNMAVVASWRLHCVVHEKDQLPHLEFRRQFDLGLLEAASRQCLGGPTAAMNENVRFDVYQHYLEASTPGRCANCGSNTRKNCAKCDKQFHEICFAALALLNYFCCCRTHISVYLLDL